MATAVGQDGRPVHRREGAGWWSRVFELHPAGLNWVRGVLALDVVLVPLVVFWALGHQEYLLSALFGVVWTGLADPGGRYGARASRLAVFALIGAALTAVAFGMGALAWGWLVLAVFAGTLGAGLVVGFGVHRATAALFLNIQFLIALGLAVGFHEGHVPGTVWGQVLAWVAGSALWIAVTFVGWLVRGRRDGPAPIAEIPGDTSRHPLTSPLVTYAVLRAVVLAGTAALAFGLHLPHGVWLPIAAIVAMKPDLEQTTLVALQRLAGAAMGAVAAALLLLIPANDHGPQLASITYGLEVVAIVLLVHAVAIRFWNYAFYTAAVAASVLILLDLPRPSDLSAEGYRVLWTLCGVGAGVLAMVLAGLLHRNSTTPASQPL